MKTLTIYKRAVLERTGYKKYPFKKVEQFTINYDGRVIKNHNADEKTIKIPFTKVLETRSERDVLNYYTSLHGRVSNTDKELRSHLAKILLSLQEGKICH